MNVILNKITRKTVKVDNLSDDESSFFSSSDDDEETKSGTRHLMSVDKDFKKMSISSSFTSQILPPSIFDLDIESLILITHQSTMPIYCYHYLHIYLVDFS